MSRLPRRVASAAVLSAEPTDGRAASPPGTNTSAGIGDLQPEVTRRPNKIVPIRLKEVDRIAVHRFGHSYPEDERGRLFIRVWLAHAANLAHDATKRMDNFLDLRARWMSRAERSAAKEQAFRELETWSAADLGGILALNMAERTRLRIGSIAPIDCDAEERAQRSRQLHRDRERDRRKRARERPKVKRPRARTEAVLKILPKVMEVPVSWVCKKVAGSKEFAGLKSNQALRAAVHRELGKLQNRGLISCETRLPERGQRLPVNVVKRVQTTEPADAAPAEVTKRAPLTAEPASVTEPTSATEYFAHLKRRLAEFTPAALPKMRDWYSSERAMRKACGLTVSELTECTNLLFARHKELKASK